MKTDQELEVTRRGFLRTCATGSLALASKPIWCLSPKEVADAPISGGEQAEFEMNHDWLFGGPIEQGSGVQIPENESLTKVTLPHSVTRLGWDQWDPTSWEHVWLYRRRFSLPAAHRHSRVFVKFDAAMVTAELSINGIPQTLLSSPWGRSGSRCLSCTEAGDVHAECTTPDFESTPMCAFAATNFAASALYSSIIAEMGQSVEMSALACDQQETSTRCYQARPLEDKSPPGGKPVGAGSCAEFADLAGFFIGVSPQAAGISSSPGPDRAGTWPASSSGRHGEDCFRRQARRVAHALPPSELVVACALRASLSEFLQDTALPRRLRILLRCYREPNRPSHCHDYGLNTAA